MSKDFSDNCGCIMLEKRYLPKMPLTDIYHYTSGSGFNSILFNKNESDNITIWASRFDCLNDKSEGKNVVLIYRELCQELLNNRKIKKDFFDTIVDLRPSEKALFSFTQEQNKSSNMQECSRYIISFSTENDSLPMWNYYSKGNYYEGFNIGFEPRNLNMSLENSFKDKNINANIYSVIYNQEEMKKLIKKVILQLYKSYDESNSKLLTDFISQRLFDWSLCFKSDKFRHEKEVRVVIDVADGEKDMIVKYRTYKGYLIPYIEIKIPKNEVTSVSFGPLLFDEKEKEKQKNIMKKMLISQNYCDNVEMSEIPVRY